MRVVIFYAHVHERDLAERLSTLPTTGRKKTRRAAATAFATMGHRKRIRPLARAVRHTWACVRGLPPLSYIIALALCGYRRARARWIVKKMSPDVIVLFEDNIGNFTRYIGAAAARFGVPYVVLPTTIPNPREAASFFRSSKAHALSGLLARRVARRWPQWVYDFDGHRMLRLPPADIIAMRCLGVDSSHPWVLNSGQASAICVECTANKTIYERLGLKARQLATIGNLADDTLFEVSNARQERRRSLLAELGLDPDSMLLVVAFPPNQFGAPSKGTFEYASFADLKDGWLRALAPLTSDVNIVLRAHPRLNPDELEPFVTAGCHVFTGPTEELVPLADLFVASISATIRWALAVGIPVINYDCYRYRYDDYRDAQGMVLVEDRQSFASALREICFDPVAHRKLCEKQSSDRGNWGCIDGQFSRRFLAVLRGVGRTSDARLSIVTRPLPRG
jgi:hypothetical protein